MEKALDRATKLKHAISEEEIPQKARTDSEKYDCTVALTFFPRHLLVATVKQGILC